MSSISSQNPNDILRASNLIQQTLSLMTLAYFILKYPKHNITISMNVGGGRNPTILTAAETLETFIDGKIEENLQDLKLLGVDTEALIKQFQETVELANKNPA